MAEAKDAQLGVRLDPKMHELLVFVSSMHGMTPVSFARECVTRMCQDAVDHLCKRSNQRANAVARDPIPTVSELASYACLTDGCADCRDTARKPRTKP